MNKQFAACARSRLRLLRGPPRDKAAPRHPLPFPVRQRPYYDYRRDSYEKYLRA